MISCDLLESENLETGKSLKEHKQKRDIIKYWKLILFSLFIGFIVLGLLLFYIIFWRNFRTVSSIKNISNESYYEMDYVSDYYFDDFLKVGASTDSELQ